MSKAQEVDLSRQIQKWLQADNPDQRTIRRGQRAKKKLIECNLRLVAHVGKKYLSRIKSNASISYEDLMQEGIIGLNRACELFDSSRGYAFSTYATTWIRQSCQRVIEHNLSTIRCPSFVVHLALAWKYKPASMTLEEFAAERNYPPESIKSFLDMHRRAQCCSADVPVHDLDSSESILSLIAEDNSFDIERQDYADAVAELQTVDGGILNDAMAILELSETASCGEMAELMDCSKMRVHRKLKDLRSQVREHAPESIRRLICGAEQQIEDAKIEEISAPKPVPELVLAGHQPSPLPGMSESIAALSTNGHRLEHEAMEVIHAVQSEPAAAASEEAVKPTKRRRRSAAEIQAAKAESTISVTVDGMHFDGQAEHIARLLNAMKQAA